MLRHRNILIALLIPLLLDLLVFFTAIPSASEGQYGSRFEQQKTETFEGLCEREERVEEEDEFSFHGLCFQNRIQIINPVFCGANRVLTAQSVDSPLSFGWKMPLRI